MGCGSQRATRYLLNKYDNDEILALYNGGEGKVDEWIANARADGESVRVDRIPFAETRDYVRRVLRARAGYQREYRRELGLRARRRER